VVALPELSAGVALAVKNGPPGMWQSLGSPGSVRPFGFLASPFWLAGSIGVTLALASRAYRTTRARELATRPVLLLCAAAAGAIVVVALLALYLAAPHSGLSALVCMALVAVWVWMVVRARLRRARPPAAHDGAEVVDLAHWRDDKAMRRRQSSR